MIHHRPRSRPKSWREARGGFLLPELICSLVLLVILMSAAVSVLGWFASDRRAAERRLWATLEAQNVLERVTLLPYDRLVADPAFVKPLGERTERTLPRGRLEIAIDESDTEPRGKRIMVAIFWRDRHGAEVPPVRLTTWITPEPKREEAP